MKKYILTSICLSALLITSCTSDKKEVLGYKYIVHNSTGDKKPSIGNYVYFGMTVTDEKDSIITEMNDEAQLPVVKIPELEVEGRRKNPIEELLRISSLNDSMTLIIPSDSFANSGMDVSQFEEIRYNMKVRKILNEEEYQTESLKRQEEMRAKVEETKKMLPDITQKVEDFFKGQSNGKIHLETTETGLQYYILEEGNGKEIDAGSQVSVHYYGALMDGGEPFDNSYRRGEPLRLTVGRGEVISGWDEGLALLRQGTKAIFVIPSDLGYGATGSGSIPGGATIMFYVDIVEVL